MNNATMSLDDLHIKLAQLDSQIRDHEEHTEKLRERRSHLSFLINDFHNIFDSSDKIDNQNDSPFPQKKYDSRKDTKIILVEILKNEARKMSWREIFEVFSEVKPKIKKSTVRVALSQMNADQECPIRLIKRGKEYLYTYREKGID